MGDGGERGLCRKEKKQRRKGTPTLLRELQDLLHQQTPCPASASRTSSRRRGRSAAAAGLPTPPVGSYPAPQADALLCRLPPTSDRSGIQRLSPGTGPRHSPPGKSVSGPPLKSWAPVTEPKLTGLSEERQVNSPPQKGTGSSTGESKTTGSSRKAWESLRTSA